MRGGGTIPETPTIALVIDLLFGLMRSVRPSRSVNQPYHDDTIVN